MTPGTGWANCSPGRSRPGATLNDRECFARYGSHVGELLVIVLPVVAIVVVLTLGRWARARRHAPSATVSLTLRDGEVRRELADGRRESVRLAELESVEVVLTPVPTADGARAFALLAGPEAASGCLVPLGVGLEPEVLTALAALRGFDLAAWGAAQEGRPPRRTAVWRRAPSA